MIRSSSTPKWRRAGGFFIYGIKGGREEVEIE